MKYRTHLSGFTLVELMVTLAIAAVLLTVALPSFQTFVDGNHVTNFMSRMANTLAYARSEAVARSEQVIVCASTDGALCNTADDADWNNRWLVVRALNNEVLKVEDVRNFNVGVNVTTGLVAVSFNQLGENVANIPIVFTATANGQAASLRMNNSGAVSIL